jgi:hypothetical protein
MNWPEIQSAWERMRPLLSSQWPKLDNEELERVNGKREELAAALGRCYGLGRDDAEEEICKFEKDVRFPGAVK